MYELYDKDGNIVQFAFSIDARQAVDIGVCFIKKPEKNTKGPKKEEPKKEEPKKEVKTLPTKEIKTQAPKVKRGPK